MKYRALNLAIIPMGRAPGFANPGILSEKGRIPPYKASRGLGTGPSRKFFLQALLSCLCNFVGYGLARSSASSNRKSQIANQKPHPSPGGM